MNEVFGVSMTSIMLVLLALLAVCLLSVAWVAWRRPVVFKLGVRNIPRRRAQTTLIVVGLMLSTLIIAAALSVGDTIDHSTTSHIYRQLGHVDEVVVSSQNRDAEISRASTEKIDAATLTRLDEAFAEDDRIDGILPVLVETVPVLNQDKGQGEPEVTLAGVETSRIGGFGGIQGLNGEPIDLAALPADGVVLSEAAANKLDATAGDRLTVYYGNAPIDLTVSAIAENTILSGVLEPGKIGMTVPLDRLRQITGQPDALSMILLSNAGGVRDSMAPAASVVANLQVVLPNGTGVVAVKRDWVDEAAAMAQGATGLFLVLGLFSVAAGIMLIVLIFTMLAAERRTEMGITRAVGAHRRQLIQQFVAEGAGYALVAGLIGATLGVVVAAGMAAGIRYLFGEWVPIEPRVTPRSLVIAYALGVTITFLAVVGSSWRISRLNIVAAVRDIPDASSGRRKKMTLVWAALLLLVGAFATRAGNESGTQFPFYAGMSLLPFGAALLLRFFGVPGRPVFTIVGLYLLTLWLLPEHIAERLWGELDSDFEMFFLSGIFMVIGATIVLVNNLGVLLAALSRLGGLFRSLLPAVRTAIAYPGASRGRTGLTIAMFSLIVFSLVMMATMNKNVANLFLGDEAGAGWDVVAEGSSTNPIGEFRGALQARGVDTTDLEAIGTVVTGSETAAVRPTAAPVWKTWSVRGMDPGFIEESDFLLQARAIGYATDAEVIRALQTQPDVAVINAAAVDGEAWEDDLELGRIGPDKPFVPIGLEVRNPDTGQSHPVTVIGIIDGKNGAFWGLYTAQLTLAKIFPQPAGTSYYVRLSDPDQADRAAKQIEAALLPNGVQASTIRDQLAEEQRFFNGILYLIEGFMGLGLFVGIAAVGVVAFRSVVERRQQIGMLRALGYQRSTVALSFLIETAFVVMLGVLSGAVLGVLLARNLFTSLDEVNSSDVDFIVPWELIGLILALTVGAAMLLTWLPARQASRLAPAEALRYE
ncbi:MAG: FtsX-like permease family protein [Chloroflexota bacterium]|nr:FtsX-like permease family protein [Chloroflexota bacterium]